jgi:hypothetical protein
VIKALCYKPDGELIILPPSVSGLSKNVGSLSSHNPARSDTGIVVRSNIVGVVY